MLMAMMVMVGFSSSELTSTAQCYNLGNAYFLANQLAEAIHAYRHGLSLDPNDQGLRANLDYARGRVQYPFENRGRAEVDAWPGWLYRPSAFQWLLSAVAFYALTCIVVTRWLMTRRGVLLLRGSVLLLLAALSGFFWLHFERDEEKNARHPLVVIRADKLPLRKGNGPSYPAHADLPVLARGMEARRLRERSGWLQIQFASGEAGWVEKSAVLLDEP